MAARCAFVLPTGGTCQAKRAAPVHLHTHPQHHAYEDASKAGLKPVSDGRAAYLQSAQHKDAMALAAGASDCWPAAYGAPGECYGKITPSHALSSGAHGGLAAADKYPAPPACQWHNDAMEQDADVRAWAEVTMFTFNGRDYPFKITAAWLTAETKVPR